MKYFLSLIIISILISCNKSIQYSPQVGNIAFQISKSPQSQAIQLATNSPYSHVGIIVNRNEKFYVAEAIHHATLTPLNEWISRGENGHYVVKRLKNKNLLLVEDKQDEFNKSVQIFNGKEYDLIFNWSDDQIYCAELVWKVYKSGLGIELSKPDTLGSFDLLHPIVHQILNNRYSDEIPYNELVVAPSDIFKSKLLEEISRLDGIKN